MHRNICRLECWSRDSILLLVTKLGGVIPPFPNFKEELKVNIEGLNKRKELMENNLKQLRDRIAQDSQNAFRIEGAILNILEIIKDDEEKEKEIKNKNGKK